MSATSLFKFMNHTNGGDRGPLNWGRADIDGAPFRGQAPPLGTEEEMQARLTKVADPHNRVFDLGDPDQNKAYLDVLDKTTNGWAQLLHREHLKVKVRHKDTQTGDVILDVRIKVYMEWVEFYMEDGKPMDSQRPAIGRPNDDTP